MSALSDSTVAMASPGERRVPGEVISQETTRPVVIVEERAGMKIDV